MCPDCLICGVIRWTARRHLVREEVEARETLPLGLEVVRQPLLHLLGFICVSLYHGYYSQICKLLQLDARYIVKVTE
jgi:hypothetical protein